MEKIEKLRKLIWDESYDIFPDNQILEEFLRDNNDNIYASAAACLTLVRADPNRFKSYSIGPLSFTYQDLDKAIANYQSMPWMIDNAFGAGFKTSESKRTY